jgi:hypothetical protein
MVPASPGGSILGVALPGVDVTLELADPPSLAIQQDVRLVIALDYTGPAPKLTSDSC